MKNSVVNLVSKMGLTSFQIEQVSTIIFDFLNQNQQASCTLPTSCPSCLVEKGKFIRKGTCSGKQRYECKGCFSIFVWDVNRLTYNSKVKQDKWNIVIMDTLSLTPIMKTAAKANLSELTVFRMRHKFLLLLEEIAKNTLLSGVIECDETYLQESSKGKTPTNRTPRKRGASAKKRGLSNEKICIAVATNRNGLEYSCVVDRGKPSEEALTKNLSKFIMQKTVLITDKLTSYNGLVSTLKCNHYTVSNHFEYDNLIHLNTVNCIHSIFKGMIRKYRGVATKYMNRYCSLLLFIRKYAQMDDNEMLDILSNTIRKFSFHCKSADLSTEKVVMV